MSDDVQPVGEPQPKVSTKSRRGRRIFGLVLIVLVLLLGLSATLLYRLISVPTTTGRSGEQVDTGGLEWVRSIYGMSNKGEDQFSRTQAGVPAADGSIWVTDGMHQMLMHFTPDGRFVGTLNSVDASPLVAPSRFAIGPDGLFYICETNFDRVRVLRPDGTDAGSFTIPKPVSIAVSGDRIAVGAVSGFAILEKNGKPIKIIGSRGKGDGQFDYVHGIAFGPDGNVYVADSYNNRLSAYDRDGKRLWIERTGKPSNGAELVNDMLATQEVTGTQLTGDQALQLPLGLTIDGAGRIVVIDMFDCSLAVFNAKDGKFVAKYGTAGAEDGQFFYPVSVGYDPGRDWFTVADALNDRIEIVRIPGSSGAGGAVAVVNRTLAGPLRACLFPFLLLLLAIIVWLVVRSMRRRRLRRAAASEALSPEAPDESA
jgi:DNA-binding beta-propeller fold protein YncE